MVCAGAPQCVAMSIPRGPVRYSVLAQRFSRAQINEHFRPLMRGVYVRKDVRPSLALRSAAVVLTFPDVILTGWSAAELLRHPWVPPEAPVSANSAVARHSSAGREFSRRVIDARDIVEVRGMRVTSPAATVAELCRKLSWTEALVAADGMEAVHPGTAARLRSSLERHRSPRTIERVLDHVAESVPSQPVARLRAHLIGAGLGPWIPGRPMGTHPTRVSPLLIDPQRRVAIVAGPLREQPGWTMISVPLNYAEMPKDAVVRRIAAALPETERGWGSAEETSPRNMDANAAETGGEQRLWAA